jgi:transcriptional regulator with XRE-family HTH domain
MDTKKEEMAKRFNSFDEFFEEIEREADYWVELAKLEFTRDIQHKMARGKVSRTELANRLEVRPGMVTRLLSGQNNFQLSTMVRIALALNCRFRSCLEPLQEKNEGGHVYCLNLQASIADPKYGDSEWRQIQLQTFNVLNNESLPVAA